MISSVALLATCLFYGCRQRFVHCPYCNSRVSQYELRPHIELCPEHNTLFMGRFSPALTGEPLAIPVPLPSNYGIPTNIKVADL